MEVTYRIAARTRCKTGASNAPVQSRPANIASVGGYSVSISGVANTRTSAKVKVANCITTCAYCSTGAGQAAIERQLAEVTRVHQCVVYITRNAVAHITADKEVANCVTTHAYCWS